MIRHLYVPVYAATLLLSAFLLFLVQPMFGKMILPLLGGSPQVWNTAMLFFQALLLAGYAYAHGAARFLSIRMQAILHLALLVLFIFVLPIAVPEGWSPPAGKDPTLWQLGLMFVAVGGPFFVLSGSAPLLQHWFAHTRHEDAHNPYFLYAASNLGSMSALIAYPFFVEPALKISDQSLAWAGGYGLLIMLVTAAALLAAGHGKTDIVKDSHETETITWQRRGLWLMLAFVPSSLMLGVTTFITTDLASVPLLWIGPLALYVSTFIIAFAKRPILHYEKTLQIQGMLLIILLGLTGSMIDFPQITIIFLHLAVFFFTALMCHQELSASKPHAGHLTQFYLIMSLGGALGGFFNAIIAPNLFTLPLEYGLALMLGCFMRGSINPQKSVTRLWESLKSPVPSKKETLFKPSSLILIALIIFGSYISLRYEGLRVASILLIVTTLTIAMDKRWLFGLCALIVLAIHPPGFFWGHTMFNQVLHTSRNFFGVIRVADSDNIGLRFLVHGSTVHGTQALDPEDKLMKLSYYADGSGLADAFDILSPDNKPQHIAVLGLGVGVTACYQQEGRHFDFFEIDPAVIDFAENPALFTYLSDCGSPYDIMLGDARIQLTRQPDDHYDLIVGDAFSSDSIPVHLLTREAFALYKSKLKKGGFIIINISNRYLDLRPVIAAAAREIGMTAFSKMDDEGKVGGYPYFASHFMIVTDSITHASYLMGNGWTRTPPLPDFRLWTDQYSNIISLFKIQFIPDYRHSDNETDEADD